jgi:hypothetical protein
VRLSDLLVAKSGPPHSGESLTSPVVVVVLARVVVVLVVVLVLVAGT